MVISTLHLEMLQNYRIRIANQLQNRRIKIATSCKQSPVTLCPEIINKQ